MAAVTLLGTQTVNTNSGTKTVTATPAVGDLIVLVVAHSGNTANVAPTDNNSAGAGTYTRVNTCVKASSADTMQVWVRNSFIGSASSTVFTHAPGTTSGGGIGVFKVTGMTRSGLNAIRQSAIQSNQGAAGTPTPVLGVAALTGNPLIGAVFNATSPATMTARGTPAYSERFDVGYSTPTTGLETMTIGSGETGTSIAWGSTSGSAFCSVIVELDTSAIVNTVAAFDRGKTAKRRAVERVARRLVDVIGVDPASSSASVDRSLDQAFKVKRLRGRSLRVAQWSAGYAPAPVATQPPVSAWIGVTAIRRRETRRHLLDTEPLHWPYIAPEMGAILVTRKVAKVEFRRRLQAQAPQVEYPLTTGPPSDQGFPSWATAQLPKTFQDRRLQSLAEAPVYPETPAPSVSVDRSLDQAFVTRRIRGKRLVVALQTIVASVAPPATSFADVTAFGSPKAIRRRETGRTLRSAPEHNVWPVAAAPSVPYVAAVGGKTKRRKHRQGLFLSGGEVVESTLSYAPFPSWDAPRANNRSSHERRAQRVAQPHYPATPAVSAQPESAWRAKVANRSEQHRKLIPAADQITYPQTPAVSAQPESAFRAPAQHRIEHERRLLPAADQITYPATPAVPAQPESAGAASQGGRARRPRKRYLIEVDGQYFEVDSYAEAEAFFQKAMAVAVQEAEGQRERQAKRLKRGKRIVPVSTPTIRSPDPEIQSLVSAYREDIEAIYRQIAVDAELRELIRLRMLEEDDEDATFLLLH